MKKLVLFFVLIGIITFSAQAQPTIEGNCGANGNNLMWTLTIDGVNSILTISGSGAMADYTQGTSPWYNYVITQLIIGDSVTSIGDYAFLYCDGLTGTLTIPNSVTTIGQYAFDHCSGFTGNLIIPNSVTTIGNFAFSCCTGFTGNLIIPNSVTTIGIGAFVVCSGFTGNLIIPNSITTIEEGTFGNCSGFKGTLTIPNSVANIGKGAFYWCGFIGNLTIPNSVINIGNGAFAQCWRLTSISVSSENNNYCSDNGVLFDKNKTILMCCPAGKTGNYTISNTVKIIRERSFWGCYGLTSITVDAVTPPTLEDAFTSSSSSYTIPIYVPCGSISNYKIASYWSNFTNYLELPFPIPTEFTVVQQNTNLELSWQNTGAASYEIWRNNILLATTIVNTYTDSNVADGENYCYRIKAKKGNCESQLSEEVCETLNFTGIEDLIINSGISVYPNPTTGQLTIAQQSLTEAGMSPIGGAEQRREAINIEVFDIIGHCVAQILIADAKAKAVPNCQFLIELNISHLQSGLYFLRIGNQTVKIIKE